MADGINILDDRKRKRLGNAVAWSRRQMQPYREHRYKAIQQFVGRCYSDNGTDEHVPINLIAISVGIITRLLAARNPRFLAGTQYKEQKAFAKSLELDLNHVVQEIRLKDTIKRVVLDSIFSWGIAKMGVATTKESVMIENERRDLDMPYVKSVSLDDWVIDMDARHWEEAAYRGNRYRLPLEWVKESKDFKNTDKLKASASNHYNEPGDKKSQAIGRKEEGDADEYQDYIDLIDVFLPQDQLWVTLPFDDMSAKPLVAKEWDGPENGPYYQLSFQEVPDQMFPLPPAALWIPIHRLANSLFNKLSRQAKDEKTILGVMPSAAADGETIMHSEDGDVVKIGNPSGSREYHFGGVSQASMALLIWLRDIFSWQAGNLDALGGLGPQSDTAKQDELIGASVSKQMSEMQDRTVDFASEIGKDLAWYEWTEPYRSRILTIKYPTVDIEVPFSPDIREGDFLDYNITIEPYSMQHQSPAGRLQTIREVLAQDIYPIMPMLQQEGISVDAEELLSVIGHYADIPDLNNILRFQASRPEASIGQNLNTIGAAKPPVTTRNVVRVNRSGATRQGKDQAMQAMLMKGGAQASEKAAIMRPTG